MIRQDPLARTRITTALAPAVTLHAAHLRSRLFLGWRPKLGAMTHAHAGPGVNLKSVAVSIDRPRRLR